MKYHKESTKHDVMEAEKRMVVTRHGRSALRVAGKAAHWALITVREAQRIWLVTQ